MIQPTIEHGPINPHGFPECNCIGTWKDVDGFEDQQLIWKINGKEVSDRDIRIWCFEHLDHPWCYVDHLRAHQANAWAAFNT